jgi:hypothetical protein
MVQDKNEIKAKLRIDINRSLLAVCFTVFALIISLKPALLHQSVFVPLQLTLAVPLLISSIFARSRLAVIKHSSVLESYGYLTFIISYAFLVNVLGILLADAVGPGFGLTFLIFNVFISATYSAVEISAEHKKLPSRIRKDIFFLLLIFFGGILPAIGVY